MRWAEWAGLGVLVVAVVGISLVFLGARTVTLVCPHGEPLMIPGETPRPWPPPGARDVGGCWEMPPGWVEPTPEPPPPPAYDLGAVKETFAVRCDRPTTVFDLVCDSVRIEHMTGEGYALTVPTRLGGRRYEDALAICDLLALAHYDQGRDLGYADITVLKRDGRARFLGSPPVTCTVPVADGARDRTSPAIYEPRD